MNKRFLLILLIAGVFCCSLNLTAAALEEEDQEGLDFLTFDSFQFSGYDLSLPEEGVKDFSGEAQQELRDIASLYDNNSTGSKNIELDGEEKEVETLLLNPVPGLELAANYGENMEELAVERWTNVDLEYNLNDRTSIRTGYGMLSRESITENLPAEGEQNQEEELVGGIPGGDGEIIPYLTLDREMTGQGMVGVSYQTNDRVTLSADYMQNLIDGDSAVFGVIYRDSRGEIKASYQIDQQAESRETITGLELAVPNMATFSASYKLINPAQLEEQLEEEKVWDFGLDVNLNDLSSISLGYQFVDDQEEDEESSVKASFKIDF